MNKKWTWVVVRVGLDAAIRADRGEAMSREQAHAAIAVRLPSHSNVKSLARTWDRGAKDDTVYAVAPDGAVLVWAIIPIPTEQTPQTAADEWVNDFGQQIIDGMPHSDHNKNENQE